MRETSKLPTEAPRPPTVDRHSTAVRSAPTHVIPLPFAAHPPTPFPQPPTSFPRRRESTPMRPHSRRDSPSRRLQNSTEFYRILQNPTKSDGNSCVRMRARARRPLPSFPRRQAPPVIPTPTHVIPAKAGIPSSRHGSPPGPSGLEVSHEITVL